MFKKQFFTKVSKPITKCYQYLIKILDDNLLDNKIPKEILEKDKGLLKQLEIQQSWPNMLPTQKKLVEIGYGPKYLPLNACNNKINGNSLKI